jgi:UDP-hydrolysing UDP-N-acetyl-D-glucosamine 2-epimerase
MGEQPERVFVTGCPSIDVVKRALSSPAIPRTRLFDEYGGVGEALDLSNGYIVVLQHPVTTEHAESRSHVAETLHAVVDSGLPAIWFWPNVDAGSDGTSRGIRAFREAHTLPRIHFFKNLPPEDFLRLVNDSLCIVGNSSVGIRECSHLGVPTVNIGSRQQGRERGANTLDVTYERSAILAAIQRAVKGGRCKPDPLYGDGKSGARIADLLAKTPLSIEKRLSY